MSNLGRRIAVALYLLFVGTTVALAQSVSVDELVAAGHRTMTAERLLDHERIAIDGILDEAVWDRAIPATDFIMQDPVLGGTPTERTEVRIVLNRDHLYMGVICYDSEPDKLLGNTMKRDEFLRADDRFMWTIDTFLDQRTGYFFEMNPSGLMADSLMGAGGSNSRDWDGIWNANARKSDIGWVLEIDLPFRTLNFDPNAPAWGINFQRTVRRKNEESLWMGHQRNQGLRRMSNAGLLLGVTNVTQGKGLDIKPYAAASLRDAPGATDPRPLTGSGDVGLDLFYNVTPSLRANLTVNTDFAETEVDQRLVNLTRFPLFFPEKRSFFVDGATFFDFSASAPLRPFFSRRIGLRDGQPQRIDVGTKLTGQAGGQDVGVLYVRTAEEDARAGEDFAVVRLKRRILRESYIGGLYTSRHTRESTFDATSDTRQTAGLDFRLATSTFRGSNNLELDGFFLWNTDVVGQGDNKAYGAQLSYPNDVWNARVGFNEVQADHAPALGFTPRAGFRQYSPFFRWSPRPDRHPWVRQFGVGVDMDLRTDMTNRWLTRTMDFTLLRVDLHSQDNLEISLEPTYERLDEDFEISEGILLPAGREYDFTRFRASFNTANRRVLSSQTRLELGSFFSGTRQQIGVGLGVRPRPGVTLNADIEWNRVDLAEGHFETRLYRLVADTQFSPWMYLVNNVQYDSVSGIVGWQSRFRWILTPGNDLFVVYTHNWIDTFDLQPVRSGFVTQDRRAAMKLVYTHRL